MQNNVFALLQLFCGGWGWGELVAVSRTCNAIKLSTPALLCFVQHLIGGRRGEGLSEIPNVMLASLEGVWKIEGYCCLGVLLYVARLLIGEIPSRLKRAVTAICPGRR